MNNEYFFHATCFCPTVSSRKIPVHNYFVFFSLLWIFIFSYEYLYSSTYTSQHSEEGMPYDTVFYNYIKNNLYSIFTLIMIHDF